LEHYKKASVSFVMSLVVRTVAFVHDHGYVHAHACTLHRGLIGVVNAAPDTLVRVSACFDTLSFTLCCVVQF
jgi:hypothetical protein